jgi:hypothetical protein
VIKRDEEIERKDPQPPSASMALALMFAAVGLFYNLIATVDPYL